MVKKDLLNFIDRVEGKAIRSVKEHYKELIEAKKIEKMSKYEEKLNWLQDTFNRFSTNLTLLLTDMQEDLEIAYQGSYRIKSSLDALSTIKTYIGNDCAYKGEVQRLYDEMNKEIELVKANYRKVYVVSKSMSSANKIAEYLEGLGFDISSLKEDEMKVLVADIDKSKLFVCGENH